MPKKINDIEYNNGFFKLKNDIKNDKEEEEEGQSLFTDIIKKRR